jgi:hypothetical protein
MHRTAEELDAFVEVLRRAPADAGRLELVVRRPAVGEREVLEEGELSREAGLVGDTWRSRGSKRTEDGSAHPDMQLNVMSALRFFNSQLGRELRLRGLNARVVVPGAVRPGDSVTKVR